jgi:predicted nuclease of predicted toxin-antitoxin system
MRLYLDDDLVSHHLVRLLRTAGHDVQVPADVGVAGARDAVHLARAVQDGRICLTRNYDDFEALHDLIRVVQGHYPGILAVRRDNDLRRNLKPRDIARAIANLEAAGYVLNDRYENLNPWQ